MFKFIKNLFQPKNFNPRLLFELKKDYPETEWIERFVKDPDQIHREVGKEAIKAGHAVFAKSFHDPTSDSYVVFIKKEPHG